MSLRAKIAAVIALVAAAWMFAGSDSPPEPQPAPGGDLQLVGLFRGPTAADDAAVLSALAAEIAAEIAWDGQQDEPYLKTGVAFDELRSRARECRLRGESLGSRQPRVRDAIDDYLVERLGTSGGPVDAAKRAAWVDSYREIARAAGDAAR